MNLQDYLYPEIVNGTRRAQYASTNIFRVYQILIEVISVSIGIFIVSGIIFQIHQKLILFLIISVVPSIAEHIYNL